MPDNVHSLRLIGMIPRPDGEYRAAIMNSIESLKQAITENGIDPTRIAPMPARMWPVAQDREGRAYALVSMCNANHRPTAIPLAKLFPEDPAKPGALPDTLIPAGNWAANHPPSAGVPPEVPGLTAPIETAMPIPEKDDQLSSQSREQTNVQDAAGPLVSAEPPGKGATSKQIGEAKAGLEFNDEAGSSLQSGDLASAPQSSAGNAKANYRSPLDSTPISNPLEKPPERSEPDEKSPATENLNRAQRVARSDELPKPFDFEKDLPREAAPFSDEESQKIIAAALPGLKARGAIGELGGALVGLAAQQDATAGRANFQKLMLEKASALQPGSSVHRRLQAALQTFEEIKDQL